MAYSQEWAYQSASNYHREEWAVKAFHIDSSREEISDFDWLSLNRGYLIAKYGKRHLAIIDKRVIGIGDTPFEAFITARDQYPNRRPLLTYLGSPDVSY